MSTVPAPARVCQVSITDHLTGATFQVERLPAEPRVYAKGLRLVDEDGLPVFCHQMPSGHMECSCPAWVGTRRCCHVDLLVAAGLFDEPIDMRDLRPDPFEGLGDFEDFEDELIDIDIDAP